MNRTLRAVVAIAALLTIIAFAGSQPANAQPSEVTETCFAGIETDQVRLSATYTNTADYTVAVYFTAEGIQSNLRQVGPGMTSGELFLLLGESTSGGTATFHAANIFDPNGAYSPVGTAPYDALDCGETEEPEECPEGQVGTPPDCEVETDPGNDQVCAGDKVDVSGDQQSVVVTAPEGFLIAGYCVKAGSSNQGEGPEDVVVDPPQATVTISHSSGKDVSHYSLVLVPVTTTTLNTTTSTSTTVQGTTTTTGRIGGTSTSIPSRVQDNTQVRGSVLARTGSSETNLAIVGLMLLGIGIVLVNKYKPRTF